MLIIKVKSPKSLDAALKEYKNKFRRVGIANELRERQQFKKDSIKKREEKKKAIYIEKKRREEDI